MKDDGGINESDCKAFEYIFHQPAFEEQYNECLEQWKNRSVGGVVVYGSERNEPADAPLTPEEEDVVKTSIFEKLFSLHPREKV